MDPSIEVRHLSRAYGARLAVDDVSFAVAPGEVLGLLGRNGAGKTTTVEILEGYRAPTSGIARVLGQDPRHADRRLRSRVGVVLQSSSTEANLRVREAVALYAGLYRRRRDPDALLEAVGLLEKARARVGALSGGQRRRLDLARAVAGDPEVLFLDEPTTGLDPEGRRRIWDLVGRRRDAGTAIVLTSHYLEEVQALADRAIVLRRGHVVAEGTPDQLRGALGPSSIISFRLPAPVPLPAGPWELAEGRAGQTLLVTTTPLEALERLAAWALGSDVGLEELEVRRPSLEDAYLELTAER